MARRIGVFLYGIVCYAIFFVTFCYSVGFIGGFLVPTRLDGPLRGSSWISLVINVLLLLLFAVQHSVMARPGFKRIWTRIVPREMERSTYVLFSSLALILLFVLWQPLGGVVWRVESAPGRALLYGLFGFGWGLVLVSTFLISHFDLFGLRQVWLYLRGIDYTPLKFVTPGPYKWVRHPLYLGWLFVFWATPSMTAAHLFFALATSAYILIGLRLEERDLIDHHGRNYLEYRERVPMLVPFRRRAREETAEAGEAA